MTSFSEGELARLFDAAVSECRQSPFTEDFEGSARDLLQYILEHPESHASAKQEFVRLVDAGPHELVAFAMHTLRYSEVRARALESIDHNNPKTWSPMASIIAAFDDKWDDADMYEYYRSNDDA